MAEPTLALIDGMALVYRGHFALMRNPRLTSGGLNTSSLYVFTNVLLQIIDELKPSHLAVAMDTSAPTFRHQRYAAYKATRDAMPEDIQAALPWLDRLLEALAIPVLRHDGWEADDIVGTLCKQAARAGFHTAMVTPDKDYAQLVSDCCTLWRPKRGGGGFDKLGVAQVCEEWQVERPEQVIDILGLMGDSSDNIPGVPGIGEKTAKALIAEHGSVEALLDNLDAVTGKRREKLAEHRDQALLSKELVTIDQDAPLEVELDALRRRDFDPELLKPVLADLEFRTLGERLLGESVEAADGAADEPATLADVFHTHHCVEQPQQVDRLIAGLAQVDRLCIDCETDGLDARHCSLLGLALCWKDHEAWYLPWPAEADAADALRQRLAPILADESKEKLGHNLKFDAAVLLAHDLPLAGPVFDTMIAAWLCFPDARRSMDALAEAHLDYKPVPIEDLIGPKGKDQGSMRDVPLERLAEYAAEDADITWQLAAVMAEALEASGQEAVFREVECPLVLVLAEIEAEGIRLDVDALGDLGVELESRIAEITQAINAIAGEDVNINSPKQLGEVLFDKLQLDPKAKRTAKSGQYQTNEQVLARLAGRHEIAQLILDYRAATKLKSTYVDQLPKAVDDDTGRVHTHFEQAVAATGRLASHDPNLQNIPVRSEMGREIRRAFVPRGDDFQLLSIDYSQIELRIAAELSGDEQLRDAFRSGHDIHTATAALVYGVEPDDVDSELRRRAKTVNFGILYGVSPFGLSERLGISRGDAKALIDGYFEGFSRLREWMDEVVEKARADGFVTTLLGRRRWLRDIDSRNAVARKAAERLAINSPVQGTAADMIKIAMARCQDLLIEREAKTRMILQVHDELVFDCHRSEADELPQALAECMRNAIPMETPIEVEWGLAGDWLHAH